MVQIHSLELICDQLIAKLSAQLILAHSGVTGNLLNTPV